MTWFYTSRVGRQHQVQQQHLRQLLHQRLQRLPDRRLPQGLFLHQGLALRRRLGRERNGNADIPIRKGRKHGQ